MRKHRLLGFAALVMCNAFADQFPPTTIKEAVLPDEIFRTINIKGWGYPSSALFENSHQSAYVIWNRFDDRNRLFIRAYYQKRGSNTWKLFFDTIFNISDISVEFTNYDVLIVRDFSGKELQKISVADIAKHAQ